MEKLNTILLLFLLWGCSSGQIKAPDRENWEEIRSSYDKKEFSDESENLAARFLKAKNNLEKDRDKSCHEFENLQNIYDFPLKDLAKIYSIKACRYSNEHLDELWKSQWAQKISNFLLPTFFEISAQVAKKNKLLDWEILFLKESLTHIKTQKSKVDKLLGLIDLTADEETKEDLKDELVRIAPHFDEKINEFNILKIAQSYEYNRNFIKARSLYLKVINSQTHPLEDKITAYKRYILTFKKERKREVYIKKYYSFIKFLERHISKSGEHSLKVIDEKIDLARAFWTENKRQKAITALKAINSNYILGKDKKSELYWILGSIYKEKKHYKTATKYYHEAYKLMPNNQSLRKNVTWALGWIYYLQKRYKKANKVFSDYEKHTGTFSLKLKFWYAKSLAQKKQFDKSDKIFLELKESEPFNYYGIAAQVELNIPFEPIEREEGPYEIDSHQIYQWLSLVNEIQSAHQYLKEKSSANPSNFQKTKDLLNLYPYSNYYSGILSFYFTRNKEHKEKLQEIYPGVIFPLAYPKEFEEAYKKSSIDPNLLRAISRQESAFNQYARSPADAFGIMQLIPKVAKKVAKENSLKYSNFDQLSDPAFNITLGAFFLKGLAKKFDDKFIPTVACYNASEKAIRYWYKTRYRKDPFEFIEQIPYKETRNYVKLVFRNFISYKKLTSEESFQFLKSSLH